jgi:isoleucyl-tRNA synthetase
MDFKDSLWMPNTSFEMRGNLTSKEPAFQARWESKKLYDQMHALRTGQKPYVLHDGPPYANGNIHIGHALNRILKDFVWRTHFQMGYQTSFIPGWDTHGLPIETAITKLGHNRKTMSLVAFRELCESYAKSQIQTQMADMKALGTISDYDHFYATLQPSFEARQIEIFGKMAMDGLIYKGLKPVYWSPSSESALAEAEIEYHDRTDWTIFVAFEVLSAKGPIVKGDQFVIWTTTPWTIPANLGISLNPSLLYDRVQTHKGIYIVASTLTESLMAKFGFSEYKVLDQFLGKQVEFSTCKHPFYDKESLVMVGDHVTAEDGTGCVHTAPGHGDVDFIIGKAYGLEAYCPVDDKGCMTKEAGAFLEGQYVEKANDTVIAELESLGALLFKETITHAYPHDWRTKKPVIFRATDQWFASIDLIREKLLSEIDAVQWLPEWGKLRMHNMIKDRGDWCISRQRAWGVPIPIFYTESNQAIMDADVFKHVADLFRTHGSNIWFEKEAKDLLPRGFTHPESPNGLFRKETDIMDVWFDSGSSHSSVIKERGGELPVDIYIEGSDQYRGWFNSSLIVSTAYNGHAPYKQVVSHGFVLDGKGEKMSKSLGNVIEPNKVVKEYGADVLRLWVASIDYQSDVRISDDILKQVIDAYKKMRNTFRFMLGNLGDFNQKDKVSFEDMNPLDQYMMAELDALLKQSKEWVSSYDYKSMTSAVSQFMSNTLSAYYLDYTKDILYIENKEGHSRRSVQTVIYSALDTLVKLMAPVLVHTTEEVWDLFDGQSSVHLQSYPEVQNYTVDHVDWTRLFELRSMVLKALETVRAEKIIGKSLEAKLTLTVNASDKALLLDYVRNLKQWLIVSGVELKEGENFAVEVSPAEGHNCPRCWNIVDHVHENGLCDRCHEVLSQ